MKKKPYIGNKLRLDGYYYSNPDSQGLISVAMFYRDGFCFHFSTSLSKSSDTLNFIENRFLKNDDFISRIKQRPSFIGVYQVRGESIKFETWWFEVALYTTSATRYGKILNPTTLLIENRVDNRYKTSFSENQIYRFKQFSPKPDSTNTFIK